MTDRVSLRLALTATLMCLSLFSVPAVAQTAEEQLERIERDLQLLQRQVYRQGLGEGAVSAGPGAPAANVNQLASLQAKSLQLESLIQTLTGQVEELQFQVRQLREQMALVSDDANVRLARIEQSLGLAPLPARPTSVPMAGTPAQPQPQSSPAGTIGEPLAEGQGTFGQLAVDAQGRPLEAGVAPPDQSVPVRQPSFAQPQDLPSPQVASAPNPAAVNSTRLETGFGGQPVTLPVGTSADQYGFALGLLRQRDYDRAEQALSLFLEAHPTDDLAGNAQYWLGETYYVRDDYQQAAVNFLKGYRTYPDSSKAPDNLLKLGMTLARLDQSQQACQTFSQLATEFPGANAAILRQLQQEQARLACN